MNERSIRSRLSLWFAAQTLFGLSIVCLAIYFVTAWNFRTKQDDELDHRASLVRHLLAENEAARDISLMRHKLEDFFSMEDQSSLMITTRTGSTLFRSTPPPGGHWIRRELAVPWQPATAPADGPLTVRIGINVAKDAQMLERLAWTLCAAVVLGTALVSLTGFWLVRRGLRPLATLAERTAAMAPDRPNEPIAAEAFAEELRPWITQFNALLLRVQRAYVQLESFNADVAHELRTPLANLIGSTQVALSRQRSAGEFQEVLQANLEDLERLRSIVNDMLFLARADRGEAATGLVLSPVAQEVRKTIEFFEFVLDETHAQVGIDGDVRTEARLETALFRRAMSNLLQNAIEHSEPGAKIAVSLREEADATWIMVSNPGAPIAEPHLQHLFDRFYRVDAARNDGGEHHGHGLGLAIVKAVARMHGGQVSATSAGGVNTFGFSVSRQASADERPSPWPLAAQAA